MKEDRTKYDSHLFFAKTSKAADRLFGTQFNRSNSRIENHITYPDRETLQKSHIRDVCISVGIFAAITVISFFFYRFSSDPTLNIAMLYTLGVFIITSYTDGYVIGFLFSICAVLSVNFFFTYPFRNFNFTIEGYRVAFAGMLIIGIITSAMSSHMKKQGELLIAQEKALAEQEKELMEAEKEKMRANLLRAVSHDIRTPLTGIIGNSTSILEDFDSIDDEEKKKLINNIRNDSNWLLNMVENLLSVTRINSESAQVSKSEEMIDEVVAAAVRQFRKRCPEAELKVKVPDEVIMVEMDALLIQQVIINILQNAELHSASTRPLELSVYDKAAAVEIHIKDYGIGIENSKLNTIFDGEGYKGTNAASDGYKGMGIGLSICKTIIMAHDGEIWAMNHEEGAEFAFSLPKSTENSTEPDLEK